ncbi:4Fe-4S dicluster domain-containing protein [Aerolutibacter ruishenii]|uniref:Cytochrome c oxidase accessory protein FixG n=1 Tax=Aerolutibacter ruishenii TaxID=686800 RepID=A0A562LXW4_9GAMM|nr:4Fe-4S dicluster domain-containing protein [Lysobacter ruishenii]TWI12484.1 cytochrome c oxidase accessory protein FixG [Lysobacter ruishenii]
MSKKIPLDLLDDGGPGAYVSERKIYPRDVSGPLNRLRVAAVFWLLGMFYLFPWLSWDGRQAVLFDLPARKFYVFGLTFWPQDFLFLAILLIIAAMALFFFTALAGRLFCGYACPQTVWTEVFLWIESGIEGDRHKRMKLDAGPWTGEKVLRKGSKHVVWLLFALWTGFTFVGFFTPIKDLAARAPFGWGGWETFWVFFYALATWGNAGFLREQVCKYMCPYARFQSAMFDRNTLIIAYDPMRGEPRGPRKRGLVGSVLERGRGLLDQITAYDYVFRASRHPSAADQQAQATGTITLAGAGVEAAPLPKFAPDELGDCIDCTMCVQVCPTGIDIRNGLQYECIACGACIDACDDIMDKMGYPHGLIRYSTQNAIDGKSTKVLRPRILVYGALLLGLIVAWGWGVGTRSPLIAEVLRDRNALFRTVGEQTENGYTLKVINKTDKPQAYTLTLETDTAGIALPGTPVAINAAPQEVVSRAVTLSAPANVHGRHDIRFVITGTDGSTRQVVDSTFFGPLQ